MGDRGRGDRSAHVEHKGWRNESVACENGEDRSACFEQSAESRGGGGGRDEKRTIESMGIDMSIKVHPRDLKTRKLISIHGRRFEFI